MLYGEYCQLSRIAEGPPKFRPTSPNARARAYIARKLSLAVFIIIISEKQCKRFVACDAGEPYLQERTCLIVISPKPTLVHCTARAGKFSEI